MTDHWNGDAARAGIFAAIRRGRDGSDGAEVLGRAQARIGRLARHTLPVLEETSSVPPVGLFVDKAKAVSAGVERLASPDVVPDAVARYLLARNLPARLRLAGDSRVSGLAWSGVPLLEVSTGPARDADLVSVTGAIAGVAETGTLVMASGADHATTLNFLPDHHLVVLHESDVVPHYEDALDRLRRLDVFPRCINFITGPSRTGDIEQTIQLGAHGPRCLHIFVVAGA